MPGEADPLPTLLADPALPGDITPRQAEALQLRISGKSYTEVAKAMGIATPTAWQYIKRAVETVQIPAVAEALLIEGARSDYLWRKNALAINKMVKMLCASTDPEHAARLAQGLAPLLARGVDIQERRAKLLGLDAPDPERTKPKEPTQVPVRMVASEQAAIEHVLGLAGLRVVPTAELEALKNASAITVESEPNGAQGDEDE